MEMLEMPVNETRRMDVLKSYDLLDTPPDGNFDRITALAAGIFKVPIDIISLVESERIWFKSHHGLGINQIDRDPGLCASAILGDDAYVVENAVEDPRTLANPLVAGDFGLRFYAAAPLRTEENYNLGTLCILDKAPRIFTEEEKAVLKQMAEIVMDEMNLRLTLREKVGAIKNLTSDISTHIRHTVKHITAEEKRESMVSYLESSGMYLQNIQSQLDGL